jgi:hypothetical protein
VRTPLAAFFNILPLLDAGLALQPPDILHNLIDIGRSDGVDFRHVAKLPMVRLDAVGRRPLEGLVSVMVRLVDLMHQRRSVVGAHALFPMTDRTVRIECGFARLELGRHSAAYGLCRLWRLCGVAGSEEAKPQQKRSDLKTLCHRDFHRISIAGPGISCVVSEMKLPTSLAFLATLVGHAL